MDTSITVVIEGVVLSQPESVVTRAITMVTVAKWTGRIICPQRLANVTVDGVPILPRRLESHGSRPTVVILNAGFGSSSALQKSRISCVRRAPIRSKLAFV